MMNVLDATEILHQAGLRRTPVRTGVIEQLAKASRPISVADLVKELPAGTDVVTVYRTLSTLADKGLARRIRGEDRSWLFEISVGKTESEHVHAHFVCDSCGTVECLPDVSLPPMPKRSIKLDKNYTVHKQEVTLHGTCPKCH
jgi:Fur family transcriptional regulator, ferric uptake regulator